MIEDIIDYFNFENVDNLVLRMNEIILHHRQERMLMSDRSIKADKITEEVFKRLPEKKGSYEKPIVHCYHFARLLKDLASYYDNDCTIIVCNADYLDGDHHQLIFDETTEKYLDPSIYNSHFDIKTRRWVKTNPKFMLNIPKEQINNIVTLDDYNNRFR